MVVFQLFFLRKHEISSEILRVSEVGDKVETAIDLINFVLVNPF